MPSAGSASRAKSARTGPIGCFAGAIFAAEPSKEIEATVSSAIDDSRLSALIRALYAVRSSNSAVIRSPFLVVIITVEPRIRGLVFVAPAAWPLLRDGDRLRF